MTRVFASDATRAVIADWVELELFVSDRTLVTDTLVTRADEVLGEPEHGEDEWDPEAGAAGESLDREILGSAAELRRTAVWDELYHRQTALGGLYPFALKALPGGSWRLEIRTGGDGLERAAQWTYIAALLMSSFKHYHIENDPAHEQTYETLKQAIAEHFQAVSALAASNLLGEVYWFGWPRPDKTTFREALADVIGRMGHGALRDTAPKNRRRIKDGTVDLVAWKSFGDRMYGSLVLYGQVASGNNWQSKPVATYLRGRFLDHFSDHPSSQYLGATFIPFLLHTELATPPDGDMAAAMVDDARQLEKDYGVVVDRLRLTQLVGEGMGKAARRHNSPSVGVTALQVMRWIRTCKRYCETTA